ncbi:MAG: hypothetical protein NTX22_08105 [Ignavibacteriales bacterium]|nr:hypothetical protein [Ignavibacteriales bacterium]
MYYQIPNFDFFHDSTIFEPSMGYMNKYQLQAFTNIEWNYCRKRTIDYQKR